MKTSRSYVAKMVAFTMASILSTSIIGCGTQPATKTASNDKTGSNNQANKTSEPANPLWFKEPTQEQLQAAKEDNISGKLLSLGVNGEKAFPADKIEITDDQLAKIKSGHYTAAIAMHFAEGDWSTLAIAGIESELKRLGINVIAKTNANFVDSTQISQLEAIIAKKPDILITAPVNSQTETNIYKKVAEAGIKVAFMNQPADKLTPGKDYVSVVAPDDFGNGMAAADELAKSLNGKGNVAAIYYAPDFNTTNLRYEGFVARLKAKYPDIKLVANAGFDSENKTQGIASALLTKYPDVQGMWVAWDGPALGAVSAAKTVGKTLSNFKIVTQDLGSTSALNIAEESFIIGTGAQLPYDFGVAITKEAALSLIGGETHPFISESSLAVNRDNLKQTYQKVFHHDLPSDVLNALSK